MWSVKSEAKDSTLHHTMLCSAISPLDTNSWSFIGKSIWFPVCLGTLLKASGYWLTNVRFFVWINRWAETTPCNTIFRLRLLLQKLVLAATSLNAKQQDFFFNWICHSGFLIAGFIFCIFLSEGWNIDLVTDFFFLTSERCSTFWTFTCKPIFMFLL